MLCFANTPAVPRCRYLISLSDGTTVFEDHTPGIPTTWNRLLQYVNEKRRSGENLTINRIRVQCSENLTNIPPGDGYFIFHREDYGAFSRTLKAIGAYDKISGLLLIYFFDTSGKLHSIEKREIDQNHLGLLLN
jgi:hypothetical protein